MRALAFAAALLATTASCAKDESGDAVPSEPAATAPPEPPKDHLAPGELLPGPDKAFGVPLPVGLAIDSYMPPQILGSSRSLKAADVANFLRARVTGGTVKAGAAGTIFDRVDCPAIAGHLLMIRVESGATGTGTLLTVRDVTPPKIDPTLSEDQRWKQVGIKPGGGRIADPTHLH
jgi:hypothetical protein